MYIYYMYNDAVALASEGNARNLFIDRSLREGNTYHEAGMIRWHIIIDTKLSKMSKSWWLSLKESPWEMRSNKYKHAQYWYGNLLNRLRNLRILRKTELFWMVNQVLSIAYTSFTPPLWGENSGIDESYRIILIYLLQNCVVCIAWLGFTIQNICICV